MNPRLAALLDRRAEIVQQTDTLLAVASEEDRELSAEENERIAENEAALESIARRIAIEERLASAAAANGGTRHGGSVIRIGSGPANNRPQFSSFGEQMVAVANAARGAHAVDPRLIQVAGTGMNEQSPSEGGFLLQPEYTNDLLTGAFQTGILSSRVRRRQIGPNANQLKFNTIVNSSRSTGSRYGGMQLYWVEEGGLKTASNPKFRAKTLTLKKLVGLCYVTDELLEDAVALESILRDAFNEEFGFILDDVILWGTGAGQPLGIFNHAARVTIAKESSQTAATVNFDNILKMYTAFWSRAKNGAAGTDPVWLVNAEVFPQLMKMTLGGTATVFGAPVFMPPGGISGKPYATLFGIPVLEIEHAAALGTEGDIALVDLKQYLMIDKGGIKTASSIHVRFIYDETCFRFVYRCDGQPLWDTSVTAYKGSNTISPYVTLATRA